MVERIYISPLDIIILFQIKMAWYKTLVLGSLSDNTKLCVWNLLVI